MFFRGLQGETLDVDDLTLALGVGRVDVHSEVATRLEVVHHEDGIRTGHVSRQFGGGHVENLHYEDLRLAAVEALEAFDLDGVARLVHDAAVVWRVRVAWGQKLILLTANLRSQSRKNFVMHEIALLFFFASLVAELGH
jgi:hypothetical protein